MHFVNDRNPVLWRTDTKGRALITRTKIFAGSTSSEWAAQGSQQMAKQSRGSKRDEPEVGGL